MTRKGILDAAEACVCGQREQDYGSPEDNFRTIAELWRQYIQARCVGPGVLVDLIPEDVAAMMILLKVGRIAGGSASQDNWVDIAGYAACGGEIAAMGGRKMSITREQAATWFETMHPPGPAAREMYRMAAEALRAQVVKED